MGPAEAGHQQCEPLLFGAAKCREGPTRDIDDASRLMLAASRLILSISAVLLKLNLPMEPRLGLRIYCNRLVQTLAESMRGVSHVTRETTLYETTL
jgi:hypothetical protein